MRHAAAFLAAVSLLGAAPPTPKPAQVPHPSSAPAWRPVPVKGAPEPSQVVQSAPAAAWHDIDPADLLVMELKEGGRVVIQLAPEFAPVHVANVRAFARGHWWDGANVYRVQDNYVAQWGNNEAKIPFPAGVVAKPPAEYSRPLAPGRVRPLGYPDSYAPAVGHVDGWPVGYDPASGQAWLTHCYSYVGVGRDLAPDTGSGGELYAVIGHAPRHLDLNIALIGRVIEGMPLLSARPRGTGNLGFYENPAQNVAIARVRLAADMPAAERPRYQAMRTDSAAFGQYVLGRANRGGSFFNRPAGGVDLCNAPVPVRKAP
jgi:peptidylprolyl isomerase